MLVKRAWNMSTDVRYIDPTESYLVTVIFLNISVLFDVFILVLTDY